jgi:hypothetical protein
MGSQQGKETSGHDPTERTPFEPSELAVEPEHSLFERAVEPEHSLLVPERALDSPAGRRWEGHAAGSSPRESENQSVAAVG